MCDQLEAREKLIEDLGLSYLSEEEKEKFIMKAEESVLKRMFIETITRLSEADQDKYEKMIDDDVSPEELEGFLRGKIFDYEEMIKRVIKEFKEEFTKGENIDYLKNE
jgi:hypothetical protein